MRSLVRNLPKNIKKRLSNPAHVLTAAMDGWMRDLLQSHFKVRRSLQQLSSWPVGLAVPGNQKVPAKVSGCNSSV